MREEIKMEDKERFHRDGNIFGMLMAALIVLPVPLVKFMGYIGFALLIFLFMITMYYAIRVEKQKKNFNIQTYKEILAFSEGKRLEAIEKHEEHGKRPYQKALLAIGFGFITLIIAFIMILVL